MKRRQLNSTAHPQGFLLVLSSDHISPAVGLLPSVTFSGGGGSAAAAYARVQNGAIVGIVVTNGGAGYTSAPTAALNSNSGAAVGTGATLGTVTFSGGAVTGVPVTAGGSSYGLTINMWRDDGHDGLSGSATYSPAGAHFEWGGGIYFLEGNATDRNSLGEQWIYVSGAAADPTADRFEIVPYDPFAALVTGVRTGTCQPGSTASTVRFDSGAATLDNTYYDCMVQIISGTGVGQVRSIQSYTGATQTAAIFPNWIVTPDNTSVFVLVPMGQVDVGGWFNKAVQVDANNLPKVDAEDIAGNNTAAVNLKAFWSGVPSGTVNAVTSSSNFTLTSAQLSTNNNDYNNVWLMFASGLNAGISRVIGTYTGATKQVQFTGTGVKGAFPETVTSGDAFILIAGSN